MIHYLLVKHAFWSESHIQVSSLHLSWVIPLHKSVAVPSIASFAVVVVVVVVVCILGFAFNFSHESPKKYHALKRIIAVGINILNTILFTILYWKLRADDIFAILLYIIPNILFSS